MFIKHPHNWREPETLRHSYFSLLCAASARENGIMIALNFDQLDLINTDPFGTIDVWWLYDDGGLSILLPHILTKSSFWRRNTEGGKTLVPLRLFIISKEGELERKSIYDLLAFYIKNCSLHFLKENFGWTILM
ncbi:hypothetical protein MHBO_000074 [Bonamia ostreae]|uniref:SLC12A transporter C-terminal domain-containing protein n=1 Tax=Bonamia ostreae TaxID=126728 RepID=A0ABV2AE97_9EUKA